MLTLHHNLFSASSQKVRLALAEKGLSWDGVSVDLAAGAQHSPAYRALNPCGVVPALVHDGRVLIESTAILEYLDDVYPNPPLRPAEPYARQSMRALIRRLDDVHHPANGVLHYAVLGRAALQAMPTAQLQAMLDAMPNRRDAALRGAAAREGVMSDAFAEAVRAQEDMLDLLEDRLACDPYLAGDALSLADLVALPYVVRLDHLGLAALMSKAERPRLQAWYGRMQARPSWSATFGVLPPGVIDYWRGLGREAWPHIAPLLRRAPAA